MICLGKSYWGTQRDANENKQNLDHNALKLKPAEKRLKDCLNDPPLQKRASQQPTVCSMNSDLELESIALKKLYSEQIASDYAEDIFSHINNRNLNLFNFLDHHTITPSLRAKMVDWMIEVLSSYKMSEQSFFRSIAFMDGYLKNEERIQETKDIHLIGVAAMFSAMKYEQIHPLRLSLMADKIARRKFDKKEIIEKESRMMCVLNFNLEFPTVFEFVKFINQQIRLELKPSLADYLYKILVYLCKMCMFSPELIAKRSNVLAAAVYFIALKTLEQVMQNFIPEDILPDISTLACTEEEAILNVGREVLQLAKSFSKAYPNLNNLKKFNRFEYRQE